MWLVMQTSIQKMLLYCSLLEQIESLSDSSYDWALKERWKKQEGPSYISPPETFPHKTSDMIYFIYMEQDCSLVYLVTPNTEELISQLLLLSCLTHTYIIRSSMGIPAGFVLKQVSCICLMTNTNTNPAEMPSEERQQCVHLCGQDKIQEMSTAS